MYSFSSEIKDLARLISAAGYEAYIVGGAVRDLMLGRDSKDVDIVVDGNALQIAKLISDHRQVKYFVLNERHSTVRVLVQSEFLDSYAIDVSIIRNSISYDLMQRDFSCNSLALPIGSAVRAWSADEIIDPQDGVTCVSQRVLTVISDQSFREDPLRLLRAFRLAVELDFVIDERTLAAVADNTRLISTVSSERVREELLRIVGAPKSAQALELMSELGVLDELLPELVEGRDVEQPPEHQSDVLTHNLRTPEKLHDLVVRSESPYGSVAASEPYCDWSDELLNDDFSDGYPRWNLLALAGLLHDIGKPRTKTIETGGKIRFLNHGIVGADLAREVLIRLRFSSKAVNFVTTLIRHHMRPSQIYAEGRLPTDKAIYRYHRDLTDTANDLLFLSLADYLAAVQEKFDSKYWLYRCTITDQVLEWNHKESIINKARYLDGHDIIQEFSVEEGPVVGRLLALLDEAVALGTVRSREEALVYLAEEQVKL